MTVSWTVWLPALSAVVVKPADPLESAGSLSRSPSRSELQASARSRALVVSSETWAVKATSSPSSVVTPAAGPVIVAVGGSPTLKST